MNAKIFITCSLLAMATLSHAAEKNCITQYPERNTGFYEGKAEGWFFYEKPITICDEEPKKPQEKPKKDELEKVKPVEVKKGPEPGSTAWLRDNLPKYLDRAVDEPTAENIKAYYLLQRLALDRASAFTAKQQQVIMGDPMVDEESRRSTTTYGAQQLDAIAATARKNLLAKIKEKSGLLFFYDSTCDYCLAQSTSMQALRNDKWKIIATAIDNKPLPSGLFPDYKEDKGASNAATVKYVPAVILATPKSDKQLIPLQQGGVVATEQLEDRIILAALTAKIVTEDDVAATRPVRTDPRFELDKYVKDKKMPLDKDGLISSDQILKYFEGK